VADQSVCSIFDCDKPVRARGLCNTCYVRLRRHGLLDKHKRKHAPAKGIKCSVDTCSREAAARGFCAMHHKRWMKHGSPDAVLRNANGTYDRWLQAHLHHKGDACLIWPYARDAAGYGPSREMCRMAHGEPPTPEHQSAHSCGNGDKGCVHPEHLRWATRLENQREMIEHGRSNRGEKSPMTHLTDSDVRKIRRLKGLMSQRAIASQFDVCHQTVGNIHSGKTWSHIE